MNYLVGDLQGCCQPLARLLQPLIFAPRETTSMYWVIWSTEGRTHWGVAPVGGAGRLSHLPVGQPRSALAGVAHGVRRPHRSDTLASILEAPDCQNWLSWLREQRLAVHEHGWLMVHAGVVPQWDTFQTVALAAEVETMLRGPELTISQYDVWQRAGSLG